MSEDTTMEPFLHNAWYIAGWSEQLPKGKVVTRTILNEPIALYRDDNGKVGALEDRCCHRGAPLSWGKVQPEGLECGYHGLIFDTNGKCVVIPGQDSIPPQARVKSYPIVERQQFIWIWMGDPARADTSTIVDWPYHDDPENWPHCKDVIPIKANYMMMIDNLMDLTHLGYIHGKTIGGNPRTHVEAEQITEPTPTGAKFIRWMMNSVPPPTYVKAVGFKGRIDRWQEFEYVAPGCVLQYSGALDVGKGARENKNQPGFHFKLFHGITPETERTCTYYWSTANGHRQDDPEAIKTTYAEIYPTFLEDQAILEVQQQRIDLDPDRPLLTVKSDRALTYARQAIRRMIEAEQSEMTRVAAE